MEQLISIEARSMALRLGLGDLRPAAPCHGYVNACVCERCTDRAGRVEQLSQANSVRHREVALIAKFDSDEFFERRAA